MTKAEAVKAEEFGAVVAEEIVAISQAMKRLAQSRLSRKALVALVHDHSKVSKRNIEIVLNNLVALEEIWLRRR